MGHRVTATRTTCMTNVRVHAPLCGDTNSGVELIDE
jgi:hypothetical protein